MKIHDGLKWQTILNRINKIRKDTEFSLDNTGSIFKRDKNNRLTYVCKTTYSKERFIEEEAYNAEAPKFIELTDEQKTEIIENAVQKQFINTYYPMAYGPRENWPN